MRYSTIFAVIAAATTALPALSGRLTYADDVLARRTLANVDDLTGRGLSSHILARTLARTLAVRMVGPELLPDGTPRYQLHGARHQWQDGKLLCEWKDLKTGQTYTEFQSRGEFAAKFGALTAGIFFHDAPSPGPKHTEAGQISKH